MALRGAGDAIANAALSTIGPYAAVKSLVDVANVIGGADSSTEIKNEVQDYLGECVDPSIRTLKGDYASGHLIGQGVVTLGIGAAGALAEARAGIAAGGETKLLPASLRVPLGNAKYGLEHILRRHAFTSGAENASKFAQEMGHIEIRGLIREAAHSGAAFEVQGGSLVLNVGMGRVIGTDLAGNATSGLRVVTDMSGNVITAYPIPWP
jgi:hypothetical protein